VFYTRTVYSVSSGSVNTSGLPIVTYDTAVVFLVTIYCLCLPNAFRVIASVISWYNTKPRTLLVHTAVELIVSGTVHTSSSSCVHAQRISCIVEIASVGTLITCYNSGIESFFASASGVVAVVFWWVDALSNSSC